MRSNFAPFLADRKMASEVLASRSSCCELEAGNKSVDIWKTKDVKCEFFLKKE